MRLLELYQILDEESELLFELRNVLNTDDVKSWAGMQAQFIYQRFERDQMAANAVATWAQKALVKYAIEEIPGTPVSKPFEQNGMVWVSLGPGNNLPAGRLPSWAIQALERGDELVHVDPAREVSKHGSLISGSMRNQVTDWLRYMYNEDPKNLTMQLLGHYSWADAVNATHEYHMRLAAEQEKIAGIPDVIIWYQENKENLPKRLEWDHEKIMTKLYDALKGRESSGAYGITQRAAQELTIAQFKSYFKRDAILLIRAFEKATGKVVSMPEDDPAGLEPYLRYGQKGEKIEDDDFESAPEIGEQWVKLRTSKCAEYEGAMMGNCVAGYGTEIERGDVWIYSFRDAKNEPHITIEIALQGNTVDLEQIKGKQNEPPVAKYHGKVIDFLKKLGTNYVIETTDEADTDLMSMGMFPGHSQKTLFIKMVNPPLDMDKFTRYTVVQDLPDEPTNDDEEPEYPEEEVTDDEHGNLIKLLDGQGLEPIDYMYNILNDIVYGQPCWYDEWEQNTYGNSSTQVQICYNGEDKYSRRNWVNVLG